MYVLTKDEYDDAVMEFSVHIFGPLSDDTCIELEEIQDAVDEGRQEDVREKIKDEMEKEMTFNHPFETVDGRMSTFDHIRPTVLGSIIEHSDNAAIIDSDVRDELQPHSYNARENLAALARGVFYTDVKRDVFDRIRSCLD